MTIYEKIFGFILKPWFVVSYLFITIISYLYLDKSISLYFHALHLKENFAIISWITNLGMAKVHLALLPLLSIAFYYIFRKKDLALKFAVLWCFELYPAFVAWVLKNALGRARPILLFDKNEYGFFGWNLEGNFHSFPSGHATIVTSLVIGLTILFPRYFVYWASFCLLIMLTRIVLTIHYLSDILLSSYLVFLELAFFFYIIRNRFPKIYELIIK
jgi:membrane-associated phospholipid phosphatase